MRKNFKSLALPKNMRRDPRLIVRVVLGALLLANLAAAFAVFRPFGGSAEELDAQAVALRQQVQQKQASVQRLRALAAKIEGGRTAEDEFLNTYFMRRQTASSTIVSELMKSAKDSGIKQAEHSYSFDPVEGSDTLSMMTIVGNYEGTYADLLQYVNRLDKSPRFLILDSLAAAPQQGGNTLRVNIKLNTFVREDGPRQ
ncbi:MAG TPA: type 4a pilus biogenesis protein PilO [Bryobacteraceae bacterium]|nr:type 4a pilus biogenesis protein PilO [Bryobacteraceae bacterium]